MSPINGGALHGFHVGDQGVTAKGLVQGNNIHGQITKRINYPLASENCVKVAIPPVDSRVCKSYAATAVVDQFLRVNIKSIEELHGIRVFENLGHLCASRDKLQHVTVVLDRS